MSKLSGLIAVVVSSASAGLLGFSEARAVTVPEAYSYAAVYLNHDNVQRNTIVEGATSATATDEFGGASATATISSQPVPTLTANVSATDSISQSLLYSYYAYYFALDGEADTLVPVTITAYGWVSTPEVSDADQNTGFLHFGTPLGGENLGYMCEGNSCASDDSDAFSIATTVWIEATKIYNLQMSLYLSATGWFGVGSASGFIDPTITIHPDYVDRYSLILSDGVGNSLAPVPVPGALLLFASGLCGLGLVGWRRKRRLGSAVAT